MFSTFRVTKCWKKRLVFSGNPVACLGIKVTTEPQLLMLYYFSAWIHQDGGKSVQRNKTFRPIGFAGSTLSGGD
jgi:hypothetical protein